jgi:transposase-like protein
MNSQTTQKRLSASDWATAVTLYQLGEKNIRELAEDFEVTPSAIRKGLAARGVEKNSKVGDVVNQVADEALAKRVAKVGQANLLVDNYAKYFDVIAKLTIKKISEAEKAGSVATANAEIIVLKNAVSIIQTTRGELWSVLDIEDLLGENAELPDLNVGEYTPDELESIREANEESFLETIEDDDEDYDSGESAAQSGTA